MAMAVANTSVSKSSYSLGFTLYFTATAEPSFKLFLEFTLNVLYPEIFNCSLDWRP